MQVKKKKKENAPRVLWTFDRYAATVKAARADEMAGEKHDYRIVSQMKIAFDGH